MNSRESQKLLNQLKETNKKLEGYSIVEPLRDEKTPPGRTERKLKEFGKLREKRRVIVEKLEKLRGGGE